MDYCFDATYCSEANYIHLYIKQIQSDIVLTMDISRVVIIPSTIKFPSSGKLLVKQFLPKASFYY